MLTARNKGLQSARLGHDLVARHLHPASGRVQYEEIKW